MTDIPLVIPNYNQVFYLKNLIAWFRWFNPHNPIYIIDNGSTYQPLLDFYSTLNGIEVLYYQQNNCHANLSDAIRTEIETNHGYYVISDPDIMPRPNVPVNFIEIFKHIIDSGIHHVGFNLIIDDLPHYLNGRNKIIENEKELLSNAFNIDFNGQTYYGYKAPIDTTFSMYKSGQGWYAPMSGVDWSNSVRIFEAFHLGWYIDPERVNPEMDNYFRTSRYRDFGPISAGMNNNRPKQYT